MLGSIHLSGTDCNGRSGYPVSVAPCRQGLDLIFEVVGDKLATFFIREKGQGRLSEDASEERMADFCLAAIQGAMLMGKVKRSSRTVEATVQEALAHLKQFAVKSKR